ACSRSGRAPTCGQWRPKPQPRDQACDRRARRAGIRSGRRLGKQPREKRLRMSEGTPFIELPVSYRVLAVESVRRRLYDLAEKVGHSLPEDPPLSTEAEAWLRRMRGALCDTQCTDCSIAEMETALRAALPEDEGNELGRRIT